LTSKAAVAPAFLVETTLALRPSSRSIISRAWSPPAQIVAEIESLTARLQSRNCRRCRCLVFPLQQA